MRNLNKLYKIEWRIDNKLIDTFNANNPRPISMTEKWMDYLKEYICKEGSLTPIIVK